MNELNYQAIFDVLQDVLPSVWEKVVFYAEYTEGSYSMKYFVNINGGSFVDCYQLKEFSKAQIIKAFMNIDRMIRPIRSRMEKEKRWNVLTLIVDASGKFRTEFDYADISENTISYHEAWKEKYLK